jgi:2-phospho-L-lactate guanylyltransferase (CobY/MobA/RfbA family)
MTDKQQKFIDCYCGDIKEAADKAEVSYGYARNLMTKTDILEAIKNRQDTEIRPKDIADRQERQEFWSKMMRDTSEDAKDRLKASELLGKSEADFTDNLHVKDDDTLTTAERENMRNILKERQRPPIKVVINADSNR